jgi:ribosomal protein S18 acetylase RimI-like enzyme
MDVRACRREDRRAATAVLVEALRDDPGWVHIVPEPGQRRRALRALVDVAVADAGVHARVAVQDGEVVGAAVWQPPGRYPMSTWRQLRSLPRMLPLARLGARARAVQRFGGALDGLFPAHPVRYLQILGVAPAAQGRGAGSRLMAEGCATADRAGEAIYLETGKPANVAYYEARGFTVLADGPVFPGGPPMWRMERPGH